MPPQQQTFSNVQPIQQSFDNVTPVDGQPSTAQSAPPPSYADRLTASYDPGAAEFGERHPALGIPVRYLSSVGGTVLGAPGALYHAFSDPPTDEEMKTYQGRIESENELSPKAYAGRVMLGIERLLGKPVVEAVQTYANSQTRPTLKQAVSVLPEAIGVGSGGEAVGRTAEAIGRKVNAVGRQAAEIAPKSVEIAGEKMPVLRGESAPESTSGRLQSSLKRSGVGAKDFIRISNEQQAKFKQIVRNIAQQTSGVGPMPEEASAAVKTAADATFDKARPMYDQLDKMASNVPDSMESVSKVTEQAIARAHKMGAQIVRGNGDSVVINGKTFSPETDPVAWKNFQDQGIVIADPGQPFSSYMKVRSQLLKMQRSATDPAIRYQIGNEISSMNTNMEAALQGTPLLDSWHEANTLWSKGYALRDVAEALRQVTEGTPGAEQSSALTKVPTTVKGPQLVNKLNELQNDGVLAKAFKPDEVKNLRQAADIMDRASSSVGGGFHVGYGVHSTVWRNLINLPLIPVVKLMTTDVGVRLLKQRDYTTFADLARRGVQVSAPSQTRKKPGEQLKDLQAIQQRSSNPNLPTGEEQ